MKKLILVIVAVCFVSIGCGQGVWKMDEGLTAALCHEYWWISPCPEIFTVDDILSFRTIHAAGWGVGMLSHVDQCINVETMDVSDNPLITSLAPLKNYFGVGGWTIMTKLWAIDVENCSITDLEPLGVYPWLKRLNVAGNPLPSVHPLLALINDLDYLNISNTPITDFTPLKFFPWTGTELVVMDDVNRFLGPYGYHQPLLDNACQTLDELRAKGWDVQENICP